MKDRPTGEPLTTDWLTFQVPIGLYETLRSIPDGRLGTRRTKRRLIVTADNQRYHHLLKEYSLSPDEVIVHLIVKQPDRMTEDDYFFKIDPQDKVTILGREQFGHSIDSRPQEFPSRKLFMKELHAITSS